jgi:hypothetical protein
MITRRYVAKRLGFCPAADLRPPFDLAACFGDSDSKPASKVPDCKCLRCYGPDLDQLRHKAMQRTDCQSDQMRILAVPNGDFTEQFGIRQAGA